jgi:hypothetical protein
VKPDDRDELLEAEVMPPFPNAQPSILKEPDGSMCAVCGKRPGVFKWGDSLAMTHGFWRWRCERCTYGPQIRHALGRAWALPKLVFLYARAVVRGR